MTTAKSNNRKTQAILLALVCAQNAFGYIDMSTGSYAIQIAIAGFMGFIFVFRGFVKSFKDKLSHFYRKVNSWKH